MEKLIEFPLTLKTSRCWILALLNLVIDPNLGAQLWWQTQLRPNLTLTPMEKCCKKKRFEDEWYHCYYHYYCHCHKCWWCWCYPYYPNAKSMCDMWSWCVPPLCFKLMISVTQQLLVRCVTACKVISDDNYWAVALVILSSRSNL